MIQKTYAEPEIRIRLATDLPNWYVDNGWISRVYRTSGWKASLMVANVLGHLAEAAWHHPEITLAYGKVTVRLMTHKAGGVTDRDFALAEKFEEVVQWQPGLESSPLRGTPNHEPRFCYLEYDKTATAA